MGHVGSNGEVVSGYAHRVPVTDHGEADAVKPRWDVDDTGNG